MGVPPEPVSSSLLLAQTAVRVNPSTVVGRRVEVASGGGIFAELPVRLLLPVAFVCLAVVLWACFRILRIVLVDRHRRASDGGAEERLVEAMSGKVVSLPRSACAGAPPSSPSRTGRIPGNLPSRTTSEGGEGR